MFTKKKIMNIASITLLAAFALSVFSACSNDGETTTPPASATTNTLDDDIINPVDISEIEVEKKELANPNLTYFGYYDMRTAGDIKPSVKLFEETYGGKIDYLEVAWGDRVTRLATLISSGDSPDLVDSEGSVFPSMMAKNMYEDLTDYIDLSLPQWKGMDKVVDTFEYKGKHYLYPLYAGVAGDYIIYNESTFEEYSIDMPRDLYNEGKWDWNTFKEILVKFKNSVPDGAGYYGLNAGSFFASTGQSLVAFENGKLINNFSNPSIDRAAQFIEELRKEGLIVGGSGYGIAAEPIGTGKAALFGMGTWRYTDLMKLYPEYSFNMVPFPRDPNSDKYYYKLSVFGYMVPSGSQNVEGAAEFINMVRNSKTDPAMKAITKTSELAEKRWPEEVYDFCDTFNEIENFDYAYEYYIGLSSDVSDMVGKMLDNITFETGENMKSWTQLKAENEFPINEDIEKINNQ